jgi:hypothetical protein
MLPTDTMLQAVIAEREREIQGQLRRSSLLGRARQMAGRGMIAPLRSGVAAVLRRHLARDLRNAVAHSRR